MCQFCDKVRGLTINMFKRKKSVRHRPLPPKQADIDKINKQRRRDQIMRLRNGG
jgi:hypothetical protein